MINKIKNLFEKTFTTSRGINRSRGNGEFVLRENDFGRMHVEADVIARYVERVKVFGVHEIQNVIVERPVGNVPLNIRLSLIIEQNLSAPKIGADLRDKIKDELREIFGITVETFDIKVTKIADEVPVKPRRRVR